MTRSRLFGAFALAFAFALLASVAGASAATYVDPPRSAVYGYGYAPVYGTYATSAAYTGPFVRGPTVLSASYLQHLWGPSEQYTFNDDKWSTSYHRRATDGAGTTYTEGFYQPKPYRWDCAGNGCGRTQYLSTLRAQARHPQPGFSYAYTTRAYW